MQKYHNLLKNVLADGTNRTNRTGISTLSLFGAQTKYDLSVGFPLLTTKKVNFNAIVHELLWFISGNTNIKYLVDNNVNIWNEWPYEIFKKSDSYNGESLKDFVLKIKSDDSFAKKHGDLGPVYGKQWRDFNGIDQLKWLMNEITHNPDSRRLIISAWNPVDINKMLLPPCHTLFQFYVVDNKLSCQLYQRSADLFLGVPFNIASYALLTHLIADVAGLEVGEFVHTIGDCHIYENHIEQVNLQLTRKPKKLPIIKINHKNNIFDFEFNDISIENYNPDDYIKADVAI